MTELIESPDSEVTLDIATGDELPRAGFRLQRVEVFNWGTFDRQVWKLNLDGKNGLLTGDIGSGKSTLVDAITTLLVPAHRVAYNKAAGADSKERSLKSYVLGYHKSERNEVGGSAKPVGLRDHNSYSVILGVFQNDAYETKVTLAQVFWLKNPNEPPQRLYVGADSDLSIASDFSNFGPDIASLKKKLATTATLFDSFSQYGAWFRRRLGIDHEQALELFHQTISMKSVGNLTEFVRTHMLQEFDVRSRIDDLMRHFDDLTRAHDSVLKAIKQVELLKPLVEDCGHFEQATARKEELRACRDALRLYFSQQKHDLWVDKIESLSKSLEQQDAQMSRIQSEVDQLRATERNLRMEIAANGGSRIEQLGEQIKEAQKEKDERHKRSQRYNELAISIGVPLPSTEEKFIEQRHSLQSRAHDARDRDADIRNEIIEISVTMKDRQREYDRLCEEIRSLKSRRSNIPRDQILIRSRLCEALNIEERELPFAGELLQVREEHRDWEGSAERLLRGFAMSVLVPEKHYTSVAEWIDKTHLKGKIVYFLVRSALKEPVPIPLQQSLATKIAIKDDTPYYEWMERELFRRADLLCCDTQAEFRRESRAITRSGQIKMPGGRHEKDDRSRIDDRSHYVLGWSNEAKVKAVEEQARQIQAEGLSHKLQIDALSAEQSDLDLVVKACAKLEEYLSFQEIDWQSTAKQIATLEMEKRELENSSDVLKDLRTRVEEIVCDLEEKESLLRELTNKRATTYVSHIQAIDSKEQLRRLLDDPDNTLHFTHFEALAVLQSEVLGNQSLTLTNASDHEQKLRNELQGRIDAEDKRLERLRDKIVKAMSTFNNLYPSETNEFDSAIESAHEYQRMLNSLLTDDLPRFRAKFKQLLNENTIREVANFQSQLTKERETIRERVNRINESLTNINYNTSVNTYIILEAQMNQDPDIRDFQQQLRACTEGALTGSEDEQYSEAKFEHVKTIIDRFRGREGQSELDKKWTARVTDVRNWFVFAASERRREDDSEFEHYSDSGGKSGGQKEKLAYTILAASLAYQFGIDPHASRAREFRFVLIDEAFGKGSDESATFGLTLFASLQMQLLVVTPLQKTHIIEPFVNSVGFVQNDGGCSSKIRNLSIEEYRECRSSIQAS